MAADNFCFYLQNRLIQTSQTEVNGTVILPPLVFPDLTIYCFSPRSLESGKRQVVFAARNLKSFSSSLIKSFLMLLVNTENFLS